MHKRDLSETDICDRFITPALLQAGWLKERILREHSFLPWQLVVLLPLSLLPFLVGIACLALVIEALWGSLLAIRSSGCGSSGSPSVPIGAGSGG